jgi:hypothetical protein
MYNLNELRQLLEYLISQLITARQFQGPPQVTPNPATNNIYHINQAQVNGRMGTQEVVYSQENFKYPAYIFENYKNIKHIKIAFFINEEIFKETNENCLKYFQDNKRKLTS